MEIGRETGMSPYSTPTRTPEKPVAKPAGFVNLCSSLLTGQLEEEKMQVYVRLGIRLLYKGASGRMEGGLCIMLPFFGSAY